MKNLILAAALLLAPGLAAPGAALAQTNNAQLNSFLSQQMNQQIGNAGNSASHMTFGANTGDMSITQLNTLKAQMLQRTNSRIYQLQREARCGQSAATPQALTSCYSGDSQIMATGAPAAVPSPYVNEGTNLIQQYGAQYLRH